MQRYIVLITCARCLGQLFMMGFDGTTVDAQIKSLIENHHLGSILLTAKNLKCADFSDCCSCDPSC